MDLRILRMWLIGLLLTGCEQETSPEVSRGFAPGILAMGDSLLAANSLAGQSVTDSIETALGRKVINRSVPGASMLYGLPITGSLGLRISKQYRQGNWDWIVLNGGGNDLLFGCGCSGCESRIEWMISGNGQVGEIPELVARLRQTGARVVYVGYLRSPGVGSMIESCRDDGDLLESRIAQMAARDEGVHFVSLIDMVPHGDRSFHGIDMIHPSIKGSNEIGRRIAAIIAGAAMAK